MDSRGRFLTDCGKILCGQECHAESADAGGDTGEFVAAFWMDFNIGLGEGDCFPAFGLDAVLMEPGGGIIGELDEQCLFGMWVVCRLKVICPVGEPVDQAVEDMFFKQESAVLTEFIEDGDDAFNGFSAV